MGHPPIVHVGVLVSCANTFLQLADALVPDVRGSLEAVKAVSLIRSVEMDAGRVESVLKIALANAMNVRHLEPS